MRIRTPARRCAALLVALSLLLSLAACGEKTTATSMHLKRTEGAVSVSDGGGSDIPLLDNLGLYSGYGVRTRSESYAWIGLDDVKLTKMDENSRIAIEKSGKELEIEVKSGALFFNITEPLEDDEIFNIRTSSMLVGIRGTCGWVEDNDGLSRVYLLEGRVKCSAGGESVQVNAGEMAELTEDGELKVTEFTTWDIPDFVQNEVDEDEDLAAEVRETLEAADELGEAEAGDVVASGKAGENVTWSLRGNTLFIRGKGSMAEGSPWYNYNEQIHTVIIGNGVTSIGPWSMSGCVNLTSITISDTVASIEDQAFMSCISLPYITIPDSVTSISDGAFGGCRSMTYITVPDSVIRIGGNAFFGCDILRNVYYSGSESQWNQIDIGEDNYYLFHAAIHYNSDGPEIVNGKEYRPDNANDLLDALINAQKGDIITLTEDIDAEFKEYFDIYGGSEENPVVLDLNGHTLALNKPSLYGRLIIRDNGTGNGILNLDYLQILESGQLTLDSGTISSQSEYTIIIKAIAGSSAFNSNSGRLIGSVLIDTDYMIW